MDLNDKLRQWGTVHSQARAAEQAAARPGADTRELDQRARQLREEADRLHRTIYGEIGGGRPR